jgi:hypothetical protein
MESRRFPPPWSVDHSPSARRRCSSRISWRCLFATAAQARQLTLSPCALHSPPSPARGEGIRSDRPAPAILVNRRSGSRPSTARVAAVRSAWDRGSLANAGSRASGGDSARPARTAVHRKNYRREAASHRLTRHHTGRARSAAHSSRRGSAAHSM